MANPVVPVEPPTRDPPGAEDFQSRLRGSGNGCCCAAPCGATARMNRY